MPEIAPLKQNLFEEDLRAGSATSESAFDKVGSSVNFWNNSYEGVRPWLVNGRYNIVPAPESFVDGFIACPYDMEIFGFFMGIAEAGSGGQTEINILKYPVGGGAPVTIFTTRPKILASSGNASFIQVQTLPTAQTILQAAGSTLPVFTSTSLSQGDVLSLDFIDKQTGDPRGLTVALFTRPR